MDKVQIYTASMVGLTFIVNFAFDGEALPPPGYYGLRRLIINTLIMLPLIGRIFGWF